MCLNKLDKFCFLIILESNHKEMINGKNDESKCLVFICTILQTISNFPLIYLVKLIYNLLTFFLFYHKKLLESFNRKLCFL